MARKIIGQNGKLTVGPYALVYTKEMRKNRQLLIRQVLELPAVKALNLNQEQESILVEALDEFIFYKEWVKKQMDIKECRESLNKLNRQASKLSATMKDLYQAPNLGTWPFLIATYPMPRGVPPLDTSWSKREFMSEVWEDVAQYVEAMGRRAKAVADALESKKTGDIARKDLLEKLGQLYQSVGNEVTASLRKGSFVFFIITVLGALGAKVNSPEAVKEEVKLIFLL